MALTLRNVRIDDELWGAVQEKAAIEGRSASEVIRDLLVRWVAKPPVSYEPAPLKTWKD